jgi:hypothetical protein
MSEEVGGSQVLVYLGNVTEAEVARLVEAICGVLGVHGLATNPNDDSEVRSVVAVRPFAWPPDGDQMVSGHLADATSVVVPVTGPPPVDEG